MLHLSPSLPPGSMPGGWLMGSEAASLRETTWDHSHAVSHSLSIICARRIWIILCEWWRIHDGFFFFFFFFKYSKRYRKEKRVWDEGLQPGGEASGGGKTREMSVLWPKVYGQQRLAACYEFGGMSSCLSTWQIQDILETVVCFCVGELDLKQQHFWIIWCWRWALD